MDTLDVTCPDCGATRGVDCRIPGWSIGSNRQRAHQGRSDLAADWRKLYALGQELEVGGEDGPDLAEAEYYSMFGDSAERRLANKILSLAETLGYCDPGDHEAA